MAFPKNNLPVDSLLWARDVEKRVENIETSFRSAEVNNLTRDTQLQASMNRLDGTVANLVVAQQNAQDAIDGLISLAEADSPYDINANNINAGTINASLVTVSNINASNITTGTLNASTVAVTNINASNITTGEIDASVITVSNINANNIESGTLTGITVQTGTTGLRTVMQGTAINFYRGSTKVGDIVGSDGVNDGVVINANTGYVAIDAGDEITLSATYVYTTGGLDVNGTIDSGAITASGSISTSGSLTRTALAGGGTTGASFNDAGNLQRTTSSARYKTDIRDLSLPYEAVLALEPKLFKRKDEFEAKGDQARDYAGFVAEELAGTPLDVFVAYEPLEDGTKRPDGIYYAELTAALVGALKQQDAIIKSLEARLSDLENRV